MPKRSLSSIENEQVLFVQLKRFFALTLEKQGPQFVYVPNNHRSTRDGDKVFVVGKVLSNQNNVIAIQPEGSKYNAYVPYAAIRQAKVYVRTDYPSTITQNQSGGGATFNVGGRADFTVGTEELTQPHVKQPTRVWEILYVK